MPRNTFPPSSSSTKPAMAFQFTGEEATKDRTTPSSTRFHRRKRSILLLPDGNSHEINKLSKNLKIEEKKPPPRRKRRSVLGKVTKTLDAANKISNETIAASKVLVADVAIALGDGPTKLGNLPDQKLQNDTDGEHLVAKRIVHPAKLDDIKNPIELPDNSFEKEQVENNTQRHPNLDEKLSTTSKQNPVSTHTASMPDSDETTLEQPFISPSTPVIQPLPSSHSTRQLHATEGNKPASHPAEPEKHCSIRLAKPINPGPHPPHASDTRVGPIALATNDTEAPVVVLDVKETAPQLDCPSGEAPAFGGEKRLTIGRSVGGRAERKRVRFSEPACRFRSVNHNTGLLNVIHHRRQRERRGDAFHYSTPHPVPTIPPTITDNKATQVLLDELQYLLDGIFNSISSKGGQGMNVKLIASSLKALVELLLKRAKRGSAEEYGMLLAVLAKQPDLLKKILNSLFDVLGSSRLVDVLVSLVFVIIYRAPLHSLLVEETNLDVLVKSFFRNSGVTLKSDESPASKPLVAKNDTDTIFPRRRGRFGRRVDQPQSTNVIASVNDLVKKAGIMDNDFKGFKNESEGSTYLMGVSLSLLLERQETAREWMQKNRRLDCVVAVLYSAQRVLLAKRRPRDGMNTDIILTRDDIEGQRSTPIVLVSAMKVLEYATVDPVCKLRVSTESNVGQIVLDLIRRVTLVEDGISTAEAMLSGALRLCLNLEQFVRNSGLQVLIDCLANEARCSGLLEGLDNGGQRGSFDVRVLCLVLLVSIVFEEQQIRESFCRLHASVIPERDGGSIALILEMLKNAGTHGDTDDATEREKNEPHGQELVGSNKSTAGMEKNIMVGYMCLLVGALVHNCEQNKSFIQKLMPQRSMLGLASVLDEFLDFQHEIGVSSKKMDDMYEKITMTLIEGEGVLSEAMGVHRNGNDGTTMPQIVGNGDCNEEMKDYDGQEENDVHENEAFGCSMGDENIDDAFRAEQGGH